MKVCSLCKKAKPKDEFGIRRHTKDGLNVYCHCCNRQKHKEYRQSTIGKEARKRYQQGQAGKDAVKRQQKRRVQSGWDKENKRKRYNSDQYQFKYISLLRERLYRSLKGTLKSRPTLELLGCSLEELKIHLESQFEDWMTWDNHGSYQKDRKTWHIDHIKPCTSFDLTDPEQQKQCFHYTNLQPLRAIDNIKKSNKI